MERRFVMARRTANVPNKQVLYKFIVYQIKGLVCDEDGNGVYIRAFDKVFLDLYGMEDFSLRMSRAYGNQVIRRLVDKIGLEQLIRLLKNQTYCNILRDLTLISKDLTKVKKKLNDGNGKGTRKQLIKEHNDLMKLYKKGIKGLRKELNIKDISKAYKNKYGHLRNFVNSHGDGDFYWDDIDGDFMSHVDGYDDYYDDDDYGDYFGDDYNPDDSTMLEDFARVLSGGPRRPRQPSRSSRRGNIPSFDYADDPDEYDDDFEYAPDDLSNLESTVRNLCGHMQSLSDTVQGLASQNRYDQVNNRDFLNHQYQRQSRPRNVNNVQQPGNQMAADVMDIKQCMHKVIDRLVDMDDRLSDVEECIDDEPGIGSAYDADLDPYAGRHVNPYAQQQHPQSYPGQQTPYVNQPQPIPSNNVSEADLINAINSAPEMTQEMLDKMLDNQN